MMAPPVSDAGAAPGAANGEVVPKEAAALQVDDANLKPAFWFNLDGQSALVGLKVGPWNEGDRSSGRLDG